MINVMQCRCCKSPDLVEYFSLGMQPLANDFTEKSKRYPLQINVCKKCYHSQLSVAVDPEELYRDYPYVSGTSDTLDEYFSWFVKFTEQHAVKDSVLEIGCNDGSQLDKFVEAGWKGIGVDPAKNLRKLSNEKGIDVITEFWSMNVADTLNRKFDVIVVQNVLGHTHDVDSFLAAAERCLKPNAPLLIQTSQADMVVDGQFDTIYHEHLSYFTARSMCALANRNGWGVDSIDVVPIHGGSYIFRLIKGGVNGESTLHCIQFEKEMGVYDSCTYDEFSDRAYVAINGLDAFIGQQTEKKQVVGYGAAAKAVVMLNAISSNLKYVIDENPLKQGKLIPGTSTLVVPPSYMDNWDFEKTVYVVLAWNFFDEICEKIKSRTGGRSIIHTQLPHPITYPGSFIIRPTLY